MNEPAISLSVLGPSRPSNGQGQNPGSIKWSDGATKIVAHIPFYILGEQEGNDILYELCSLKTYITRNVGNHFQWKLELVKVQISISKCSLFLGMKPNHCGYEINVYTFTLLQGHLPMIFHFRIFFQEDESSLFV